MNEFIYPVPANSRISQFFGERPEFYQKHGFNGHPGVDFAVPINTPVASVFWGEVIELGWSNKGWGIYIKVKHDDLVAIYAHLNRVKAVKGCYITRGQLLGYSGNTGLSTGSHLHFGIKDTKYPNNGYQGYKNPMPYFKKTKEHFPDVRKKVQAEINQIKKDGYTKKSMYIHVNYIEKILKGG